MKTFHCDRCGQQVFFENVHCENCGGMLGYQPEQCRITTFETAGAGLWRSLNVANAGRLFKQCINYSREEVCNWMLPADSTEDLCSSCQLTHSIPVLSGQNRLYWRRLEAAKRRLLYSLIELNLTPVSKLKSPEAGLAFEFLQDLPTRRVMTGHDNGLITLNIAEADPAFREKVREQMHEPYRTLLGHFRHESGHYYFDRLIVGSKWLDQYRQLFGDERADYGEALQHHYKNGPPDDWNDRYISTYASAHPWEDWAESWAHYLHMIDTLDTAFACGMTLQPKRDDEPQLMLEEQPLSTASFNDMMADWFALTYVLNSLNRSIGMPDAYPFTLSPTVRNKLRFIHAVILDHHNKAAPNAMSGGQGSTDNIAI
jgi:hypothetical protein